MKTQKNPWIAAILNLVLPGVGYLYVGKKHIFVSIGFLTTNLFWILFATPIEIKDLAIVNKYITMFIIALSLIVFAFDAYKDSVEVNAQN